MRTKREISAVRSGVDECSGMNWWWYVAVAISVVTKSASLPGTAMPPRGDCTMRTHTDKAKHKDKDTHNTYTFIDTYKATQS